MPTIATAAANPLNNCQRLYPSMDRSPFSARRGKATVTSSYELLRIRRQNCGSTAKRAYGAPHVEQLPEKSSQRRQQGGYAHQSGGPKIPSIHSLQRFG